jgi:MarR-like DNA-binding transcriptional regulator SgrR of sgrS sRNA
MIKLIDILTEVDQDKDRQIHQLLSDWIVSSLSDTEKRQQIGYKLEALGIPEEYKTIPSSTLYRVRSKNTKSHSSKYVSYAYDYRGLNKMIKWLKQIFGVKEQDLEVLEVDPNNVNVIICIPTFYKKTKIFGGKQYEKLWKTEYEVIVKI